MRTRNSSSIGGTDQDGMATMMESNTNRVHDIPSEQHPLLPPSNTRNPPGRRPPPPPPPPPIPPPSHPAQHPTNRPSEAVAPPPPSQRSPVSVSNIPPPPQQQQQQQERTNHTVVVTSPPPPPHGSTPSPNRRTAVTMFPGASRNDDNEVHHQQQQQQHILPQVIPIQKESIDWILQVRVPIASSLNYYNDSTANISTTTTLPPVSVSRQPPPVRKVQMTTHSDMDVNTLSNCLQQCLNYYPNNNNNSSSTGSNIAGLFCETTQTFYSLQHILSWDNYLVEVRKQFIYAIELPHDKLPSQQQHEEYDEGFWRGWYHYIMDEVSELFRTIVSNLHILLAIVGAVLFYYHHNTVSDSILLTYSTIYSTMIEQPLRDIYRYGPWFVGWEGDDISTICARITYHGDAQFWLRNMSECQRIYAAKEHAFIRIVLPFIYIIGTVLFVYTIRFLIKEYQNYQFQLYNNHRNPLERDMADLYHSFHVILRQILQVHNNQQRPPSQQKHRLK